ncbi:hypothetical protein EV122DRAFT_202271 [Schizophyllum commune]
MSVLSKFALRPYLPDAVDTPDAFEVEGVRFIGFDIKPRDLAEGILARRLLPPGQRLYLFSGPDWTSIDQFSDAYIPLLTAEAERDPDDPLAFVLRDDPGQDIQTVGGLYRAHEAWRDNYGRLASNLERALEELIAALPENSWYRGGKPIGAVQAEVSDLQLTQDKIELARDCLWHFKHLARVNLGLLNWYRSTFPWWQQALSAESRRFVNSLNLAARPKRGCLINLLTDWAHVDLALLLDHEVPFACYWPLAVDSRVRFRRLRSQVIWRYYYRRSTLGREPTLEELECSPEENVSLQFFDFLLQDRRHTNRDVERLEYDPSMRYYLILHEGWKPMRIEGEDYIRRCLERYHAWVSILDPTDRVLIIAWAIRAPDESGVEGTIELDAVVNRGLSGASLAERSDMNGLIRREMYKWALAPTDGLHWTPWGDFWEEVPSRTNNVRRALEDYWTKVAEASSEKAEPELGAGFDSPPALLERLSGEYVYPEELDKDYDHSSFDDSDEEVEDEDDLPYNPAATPYNPYAGYTKQRHVVAPRAQHSLARLELSQPFTLPDPMAADKSSVVTARDGAEWVARYGVIRRSLTELALYLFPRRYPRVDDSFFLFGWADEFVQRGFIRLPRHQDRVRFRVIMDALPLWSPAAVVTQLIVSGIRFCCGHRLDYLVYEDPAEIGPKPSYRTIEPPVFKKGGRTLFEVYRSNVEDLCRRHYGPAFVYYGGLVSAIARRWGGDILKDRMGNGVSLVTRYHVLGDVVHPQVTGGAAVVLEQPPAEEIDIMLGMTVAPDGTVYWMFPPTYKWDEEWPHNGEWYQEEERFFRDIADALEAGSRTALTDFQWFKVLSGRAHRVKRDDPTRNRVLSPGQWGNWSEYLDFAYARDGEYRKLSDMVGGEQVLRLAAL